LPARLNIPKEFLARPAKAEFGDAGGLTPRENGAVKPRGGNLAFDEYRNIVFREVWDGAEISALIQENR